MQGGAQAHKPASALAPGPLATPYIFFCAPTRLSAPAAALLHPAQIRMSQEIANYFVAEARRNLHKARNVLEEDELLIYNFM